LEDWQIAIYEKRNHPNLNRILHGPRHHSLPAKLREREVPTRRVTDGDENDDRTNDHEPPALNNRRNTDDPVLLKLHRRWRPISGEVALPKTLCVIQSKTRKTGA